MDIYQSFARFYTRGRYPDYSLRMAELLPDILKKYEASPSAILDMACGEGSFAMAMAQRGFQVTGVDLSPAMIAIAREKAESQAVDIEFINRDIRSLSFDRKFDLVTCWYDSLNYLLTPEDLYSAFSGAAQALKDKGLFIFDLNTIYGLSDIWQEEPCAIEQDLPDLLEIHRKSYDDNLRNSTLKITGFLKEKELWKRFDETHIVHGFSLEEIRDCIERAGLKEIVCWGSILKMTAPRPDSGKVWFVTRVG